MNWSRFRLVEFALGIGLLVGSATAQTPAGWEQRPDESANGLDVALSMNNIGVYRGLADDFLATSGGAITGVRIWGSWLNDFVPKGTEGDVKCPNFTLRIYGDLPILGTTSPSQPGIELWHASFTAGQYTWTEYKSGLSEHFYDPHDPTKLSPDTKIFQYDFTVPAKDAFVPTPGTTYWLGLDAFTEENAMLGWKTSPDRWNNSAMWWYQPSVPLPPIGILGPLSYPQDLAIDSQLWGQPMDLAFSITVVPEPRAAGALIFGLLLLLVRHPLGREH